MAAPFTRRTLAPVAKTERRSACVQPRPRRVCAEASQVHYACENDTGMMLMQHSLSSRFRPPITGLLALLTRVLPDDGLSRPSERLHKMWLKATMLVYCASHISATQSASTVRTSPTSAHRRVLSHLPTATRGPACCMAPGASSSSRGGRLPFASPERAALQTKLHILSPD